MGQKKGQTGNLKGRPSGTPNRVTSEMKERVQMFIANNIDTLQDDFNKVEPKDRLIIFERLLKFVIPTKVEQDLTIDERPEMVRIYLDGETIDLTK